MNWVDLVIIIVLLFFAFEGLGRPLISEMYDLASFIIAFILSLQFFTYPSHLLEMWFSLPKSLANVLGFIVLWYIVELFFFFISRLTFLRFERFLHFPGDRILSIIPSMLRGVIFLSIILVLVGTFPIQPQIKKSVNESKIGSVILQKTYNLENPLSQVFGGLAQDSLTFLTIQPRTTESVDLGFRTQSFWFDSRLEQEMIALVNRERTMQGLRTLQYDSSLQAVARDHSADMLKRGYFSHYSPEGESVADRAESRGVNFLVIGENLAYAPSLEIAHRGLMNSPGHRANILSEDYHKIGVGVANANEYGIMFTQVFSN